MKCNWHSNGNRSLKCNRHADSSGYCVFHKENKSKRERILFNAYIKKGKINNFTGFCFEDRFDINDLVNFQYEKLKFCETKFKNEANFSNFIFKNSVDFTDAHFESYVDFKESTFLGNCVFNKTIFNSKYINEQVFQKSDFNCQKFIVEKCINFPRLDGVVFSPYTKFILKDVYYSEEHSICGRNNYRIARIQAQITEDDENVGYYYYNERNYASNFLKSNKYNGYKGYLFNDFFDFLSKYFIGYGEKPINLLLISFSIVSLFAFIYLFTGIISMDYGLIKVNLTNNTYSLYEIIRFYIESWYFSMITFSTVGYGDIIVSGFLGKILVCIEVFLGITIHATWTSILFSKLIK